MQEIIKWFNYRILLPLEETNLFTQRKENKKRIDRNIVLNTIFTNDSILSKHKKKSLEYRFIRQIDDDLIVGKLFFDKQIKRNEKYEKTLTAVEESDWKEAIIIINTNPFNQSITVSQNNEFGQNILPKLNSLAKSIEKLIKDTYAYGCHISPLITSRTFWDVVKKSDVYSLTVSSTSTNFYEVDNFQKEAKNSFENLNANRLMKTFSNDTEPLSINEENQAVTHIIKGNELGVLDISIKGKENHLGKKNKMLFDSRDANDEYTYRFETEGTILEILSKNNIAKVIEALEKHVVPKIKGLPAKPDEEE
ncbi:MAG: hypothetical protein ACRCS8_00070 [Brevinema sp.]